MKTESKSISEVLTVNSTSFFIPPFQRSYAWGKNEAKRFFDDVCKIIESEDDPNQHDKLEHFFGTIVTKTESGSTLGAYKTIIVDGQQRITTTLLLIIALRDSSSNQDYKNQITNQFLRNNSSTYEEKIKLKQVSADWLAFKNLVNNEQPPIGNIKNVYDFFVKTVLSLTYPIDQYLNALKKVNMAIIILDERPFKGEDPQVIFETLNSLGKPLTLSDLIRNFVLLDCTSDQQTDLYDNIWYPKIEEILKENTSDFFRDFMQYKESKSFNIVSDNNTKDLYRDFKKIILESYANRNNFIADIIEYVPSYMFIINKINNYSVSADINNNKIIKELLRNIFHDIKSEPFKPFVLGLIKYRSDDSMTDEMLIEILTAIRSYLTRRRVLSLSTGENKDIPLLSKEIKSIVKGNINIWQLLSQQSYNLRFPNDKEVSEKLRNIDFYHDLKVYRKYILGKIEEKNAKVAIDFRNENISIEHIMPQTLTSDWELELGDDYDNIHKSYLNNIGNLILTEFNSEIGNKSFAFKKAKLAKSSLYFRLDVVNQDLWGQEAIITHQTQMIEWFLSVFSLPKELQNNDNWNTESYASNQYSIFDDKLLERATGAKPKRMFINKVEHTISTWRGVHLWFLWFLQNENSVIFENLIQSPDIIFGNLTTILDESSFLEFQTNNAEKATYYKTISSIVVSPFSTNEKVFYVHLNISAIDLIKRIRKIITFYNLTQLIIEVEI